MGFDQKMGDPIPLDAQLLDENGDAVSLREFFHDKPVILCPVYYRCPMLCGLELNGLVRCLRTMDLSAGTDFQIVTFSIDPRETPDLARGKRKTYLDQYQRASAETGWHFLTADQYTLQEITHAIGFRSQYHPETSQYAPPGGNCPLHG